MQCLAVLIGLSPTTADDGAYHHRNLHCSARTIAVSCDHVDELIDAQQQKVHAHVDVNGSHAIDRRAHSQSCHGVFGKRGAEAALRAEFLHQALGAVEYAFVIGNIDAIYKNTGVAAHFLGSGFPDGFAVRD